MGKKRAQYNLTNVTRMVKKRAQASRCLMPNCDPQF
uniref:Uncharacterized protein n=2 Tax=Arundo donax TaxID=35708 RepID=A0A0A9BXY0_ARUDO